MCFTMFLKEKNVGVNYKNNKLKRSQNLGFFQFRHGFGENSKFSHVLILGKIAQENVFYDVFER